MKPLTVDRRMIRLVRVVLPGWIAIVLLAVVSDFYRLLPQGVRNDWAEILALIVVSAYGLAQAMKRAEWLGPRTRDRLHRLDSVAEGVLWDGLAIVIGVYCGAYLITWIPHYLTWPWSRDEDTFAVLALSWDRGILPYRDIRAYNFPGETYVFWVLGKLFGWGRTLPFYAMDVSVLVALGLVLVAWSRQRLGGAVAGLIGYLAFLNFYLSQPYQMTGERDWHTALLVCLGLLVLQTWPGRAARVFSAMATAMALSIRPHAVLFLPALVVAVGEAGPGWGRRVLEWGLWLAVFVGALFAPLADAGILDDLIRGLRVASYGGPYSKATPASAAAVFFRQFLDWRTDVPVVATFALAIAGRGESARLARAWSWAWVGALLYRVIHPVQHAYLIHPVQLVGAITWALPVAWLIACGWMSRPVRLVVVVLLAYEIVPRPPWMCSPKESLEAIQALSQGEAAPDAPLGGFQPFYWRLGPRSWSRYCDLLDYLRQCTGPETMVANVLNRFPYESINGPTGRLSPFRAESGICWLSWVDIDLDPEFARDLERSTDSVVVWEPAQVVVDPRMKLERVIEVVRRCYEPAAAFGPIEVWRRKPAGCGWRGSILGPGGGE